MLGRYDEAVETAERRNRARRAGRVRTDGGRVHARQQGGSADSLRPLGGGAGRARRRRARPRACSPVPCCCCGAEMHAVERPAGRGRGRSAGGPPAPAQLRGGAVHAAAGLGRIRDGAAGRRPGRRRGRSSSARWPARISARSRATSGRCCSLGARVEAERALAARDDGQPADDAAQRIAALSEDARADAGHARRPIADISRLSEPSTPVRYATRRSARGRPRSPPAEPMNEPLPLAYALLRHAEALSGRGRLEAAAASAREALELARSMGAAPLARRRAGPDPARSPAP